jgi:hypothetical protein
VPVGPPPSPKIRPCRTTHPRPRYATHARSPPPLTTPPSTPPLAVQQRFCLGAHTIFTILSWRSQLFSPLYRLASEPGVHSLNPPHLGARNPRDFGATQLTIGAAAVTADGEALHRLTRVCFLSLPCSWLTALRVSRVAGLCFCSAGQPGYLPCEPAAVLWPCAPSVRCRPARTPHSAAAGAAARAAGTGGGAGGWGPPGPLLADPYQEYCIRRPSFPT